MSSVINSANSALASYIEDTTVSSPVLEAAREDTTEFGLAIPDAMTGQFLSALAAASQAKSAIAVTPAASVVGLHLMNGLSDDAILSCIDPEPEHQKRAKETFRDAGYPSSRFRFLPSRPLDVMGRLATNSYQLIYGELSPLELKQFIDAALPLLSSGGALVLADSLLDGTIADSTRKDRDTQSAREADEYLANLEGVTVSRLPLGAGLTLVIKK